MTCSTNAILLGWHSVFLTAVSGSAARVLTYSQTHSLMKTLRILLSLLCCCLAALTPMVAYVLEWHRIWIMVMVTLIIVAIVIAPQGSRQ